jgi:hypothetical protein
MLAEDATFAMPPLASWYAGRDAIATWARNSSMSGDWRWRAVPAHANGQHITVADLATGEVLSVHHLDPNRSYWRNQTKQPGRWPSSHK